MGDGLREKVDRIQRRNRPIGFGYAVVKRYGEDHGGWLGSLISYYGFFSLYPLIVVFVTLATWLLNDRPDALHQILEVLWSRVPFAEDAQAEIDRRVSEFSPNSWVLILSLIVTLWGGLGVVRVLQDAVNTIWGVARFRRPGLVLKIAHSVALVGLLGAGLIGTAVVAGVTLAAGLPLGGIVAASIANIAMATGIAIVVYRLALPGRPPTNELLPGALFIAIGAYAFTLLAGIYIQQVVTRMTGLYGPFASTIGLLAYVSVVVQVFVFGTEINVVRAKRLWPRSMTSTLSEADHRAIHLTMAREALAPTDLLRDSTTPVGGEAD